MKINMDNSMNDNRQFVLAVKKVYFQAKPAITRPYLKRDFFRWQHNEKDLYGILAYSDVLIS